MKIAGALLLALAGIGLSSATPPIATGPGTEIYSGMPPERFRGENLVAVAFVHDVNALCRIRLPQGVVLLGCTVPLKGGGKVIVMPHPCSAAASDSYALLACHELGHVNGWTALHEE